MFATPFPCLYSPVHLLSIEAKVEPSLVVVFQDLQRLVALINDHSTRLVRMKGSVFQLSVSSIQSRLLQLRDVPNSVVADCFCLGMLAFLTTMFRAPGLEITYGYLGNQLRDCCQKIEISTPELQTVMFWLLMISRIAVFKADPAWLRVRWQKVAAPGLSWATARRRLQSVVWINFIHDEPGRKAFDG